MNEKQTIEADILAYYLTSEQLEDMVVDWQNNIPKNTDDINTIKLALAMLEGEL